MVANKITYLNIFSIIYMSALVIIYFSKQRINNRENKAYTWLVITNLSGLFLQLACDIVVQGNYNIPPFIGNLILKLYLVHFIIFLSVMTRYLYIITYGYKHKELYPMNTFTYIILGVIILLLPIYSKSDALNMASYTYGASVNATYIISFIISLYMLLLLITNRKVIDRKKSIPLYLFILFGTICGRLQQITPELTLMGCAESLICFLMFHTIENPDVKMIQELNIARDRADKANNAKTEFLSSMSHEIRTPLNAIDGFSQLILEENDINVIKDEAKDIMAASQNLLEIVNGILDISKIEADKLEIVNVEYEPSQIFKDVATLAKSRIGEKPVEFKEHIAEDLPDYLMGDYTRIKQITLNLLTNAVKYTKDGYVDYSVRCVRQDDICRLIIMVKDTGIGIKKENVDKLFKKFERFDKEQNITIEGTGLGLAITKKLVDLMGGRIIADSIYGTGSIFAVVIDQRIVNKKKVVDEKQNENDKTSFANSNVLVVDDNKINLKVATKLLETYGVKVETVISGFECIERINSGHKYDIILMDDMMPKMSGTETFKKLQNLPNFNTPVVALTANAIAGMKEKYLNEGFCDYISKPIDKKELERVLNSYLN